MEDKKLKEGINNEGNIKIITNRKIKKRLSQRKEFCVFK